MRVHLRGRGGDNLSSWQMNAFARIDPELFKGELDG